MSTRGQGGHFDGRPAELLLRLGSDSTGRRGQAGELLAEAVALLKASETQLRPRLAVMYRCGLSVEALELVREGWAVLAFDETPTPAPQTALLTLDSADIEDAVLPTADLIYTAASLPFRPYEDFAALWARIVRALQPGGWFVGYLLGDRDSWADDPDATTLAHDQVLRLLNGFRIEALREREKDISSSAGWIHSHTLSVIARRGRRGID